MPIPPVLRSLLTATGPSGYETAPAAVWREAAGAFADEVSMDVMGTSTARVKGTAGGPSLAIVGHIDELAVLRGRGETVVPDGMNIGGGGHTFNFPIQVVNASGMDADDLAGALQPLIMREFNNIFQRGAMELGAGE